MYGESFTPSPVTSKSGRGDASDTEDEDFDASMLSDDSDAEDAVPDALDPSDLTGLGIHPNKKVKVAPSGKVTAVPAPPLAPIRPAAPIYVNPLPLEISPNQRPHMKYQIVRSPTPPDITERRTSLM